MVIYEDLEGEMVKAYSDLNKKIHGGKPEADYNVAIDPKTAKRTYTETELDVDEAIDEEATDEDFEEALKDLGVL